jgi:hypothetical protein
MLGAISLSLQTLSEPPTRSRGIMVIGEGEMVLSPQPAAILSSELAE